MAYKYQSTARWTGGRAGILKLENRAEPLSYSSPPEFKGEPNRWTPEHMLCSAVASCYVSTFLALAEYTNFTFENIEICVTGEVEKVTGGYKFTRLTLRPLLTLRDEMDREEGFRILQKAEKACLVSRSLNAELKLEAEILMPDSVEIDVE